MDTATVLHEDISEEFNSAYKNKKSFKLRYDFWQSIIAENSAVTQKAMDLGCGPGWMTKILADKFNEVVAVDGAESMIKLTKEKIKNQKGVTLINANINQSFLTEFSSEKFDLIICSSLLEYIKDIHGVISGIRALLKKNGKIIFSIPNKRCIYRPLEKITYNLIGIPAYRKYVHHEYTLEQTKEIMDRLGYKVISADFQGYIPYFTNFFKNVFPSEYVKPLIVVVGKSK